MGNKQQSWHQKWWGILILFLSAAFILLTLLFGFLVFKYYNQIKQGLIDSPAYGFTLMTKKDEQSSVVRAETGVKDTAVDPAVIRTNDSPSFGSSEPQLTIVEFADFLCPASFKAHQSVRELGLRYKDKVKFIFRTFPLEDAHPGASFTAEAALCAHQQEKFWPMHDKIFQGNLSGLPTAVLQQNLELFARQIGLDEEQFSRCLNSRQFQTKVKKDLADGTAAGVVGTPTFFFNGQKVPGAIPKDIFEKIIQEILSNT